MEYGDLPSETSDVTRTRHAPATRPVCVLVLGMHRSGTSALTRVLSIAGAKLPEHLMSDGVGNETGHWESERLVACHDRLLGALNSAWDDWMPLDLNAQPWAWRQSMKDEIASLIKSEYGGDALIVAKDPRICRFAELFIEATESAAYDSRCVLVVRSPLEVAQSLETRNGMSRGAAALLWLRHMLDAEAATRGRARSIVTYDDLLSDWSGALAKVTDDLALQWPHAIPDVEGRIGSFLRREHRHHWSSAEQLLFDPLLRHWVSDAYEALLVLAKNPNAPAALSTLDAVRKKFDDAAPVIRQMLRDADASHAVHVEYLIGQVGEARTAHEGAAHRAGQLEEQEQALRAHIAETDRQMAALRGELETVAQARDSLAAANRSLQSRLDEASRAAQLLGQHVEAKAAQVALHQKQLAELEAARAADHDLKARRDLEVTQEAAALQGLIAQKSVEIADLQNAVIAYERQLSEHRAEASTYGARLGRLLNRARKRLAPVSSPQAKLLGGMLRFAERTYRRLRGGGAIAPVVRVPPPPASSPDASPEAPISQRVAASPDYAEWISAHEPSAGRLEAQRQDAECKANGPLISIIVPVYKVPSSVLAATVNSVRQQTYPNWELCIAYADLENEENWKLLYDFAVADERIRPIRLNENQGISGNSNAAFAISRGEFIGLLDHDDELTPWALYDMARASIANPKADFFYGDKDCIDEHGTQRLNPLFKPAWSPEMMFSVNYLTHFNVMRRAVVERIGGWRPETDGAQDWDLFLRVIENGGEVVRVPGVHYHWRLLPTSTATGIAAKPYAVSAQFRTIKERVARLGLRAHVTEDQESGFRLHWAKPSSPCVDIVICDPRQRDLAAWLSADKDLFASWTSSISIVSSTAYTGGDIAGLKPRVFTYASEAERTAAMLTAAASGASPVIAFVSGEVDSVSDAWLMDLAGWVQGYEDIGFAGSLLLTRDSEVIEAGRVVGASGTSAPLFLRSPLYQWGWFGGPLWFRNVTAVAPHLAVVRRSEWGGDESRDKHLPWQDVFIRRCAQIVRSGKRGVVNPRARATRALNEKDVQPYWDDTFRDDPNFHPAFASVSPLKLKGGRA
ncbi:MAG: hypothetical protein DCF16_02595 [Alphaproteobacteria bacterium]|nr:MAG: hypothetical protein DCF16_02595 [Alphaproteobacteria bacterium]